MEEILDVFRVIEGRGGSGRFGNALFGTRLAGVYAFENAEAAKVGEGDLEFADGLGSGEVVLRGPGGACEKMYEQAISHSMDIQYLPFFFSRPIIAVRRRSPSQSCIRRSQKVRAEKFHSF